MDTFWHESRRVPSSVYVCCSNPAAAGSLFSRCLHTRETSSYRFAFIGNRTELYLQKALRTRQYWKPKKLHCSWYQYITDNMRVSRPHRWNGCHCHNWSGHDVDLWHWKFFSSSHSYKKYCDKFHWNPSLKGHLMQILLDNEPPTKIPPLHIVGRSIKNKKCYIRIADASRGSLSHHQLQRVNM